MCLSTSNFSLRLTNRDSEEKYINICDFVDTMVELDTKSEYLYRSETEGEPRDASQLFTILLYLIIKCGNCNIKIILEQ
jgi:hypothetical protein